SRHQQKIPWVVSSSTIWPLTTTTDQSKNIPFVRSGYFSSVAIACSGVIDATDAENPAWAASWFCLSCDQPRKWSRMERERVKSLLKVFTAAVWLPGGAIRYATKRSKVARAQRQGYGSR